MAERTLVSVDLDGIDCYHAIHGLPPPDAAARDAVLRRCLPRFLELFERLGVRATFFVIGADLARELDDDGPGAGLLREALGAGHELANHSHAHRYDLVRHPPDEQGEDLRRCDAALRALGANPCGFRAPGYTHDAGLLGHLAALGYRYDSSALPSPPYYFAKLAAIAWHRLAGRRSRSMVRGAASFFGPRRPHAIPGGGLVELPISTIGALRLPLVGTFLLAGPRWLRGWLRRGAMRQPDVHLELHALDLADAEGDGLAPALARLQPELRSTLAARHERLTEFLRERGATTRLCDAAASVV